MLQLVMGHSKHWTMYTVVVEILMIDGISLNIFIR